MALNIGVFFKLKQFQRGLLAEKENSLLLFFSFFEKVSTPLASGLFCREELEINWAIAINLKMVNEMFSFGPGLFQVTEKLGE